MKTLAVVVVTLFAASAAAQERLMQFRSIEDASTPADPAVCAAAPFQVNLVLGASLWSTTTRKKDGRMVNDMVKQVGTATACGRITSFAFPSGLQQQFHVQFNLADGVYVATGTCTL